MQEMRVWSLVREDPLKKGKATHSSVLAGTDNPTDRGAWWAAVHGLRGVRRDWGTDHSNVTGSILADIFTTAAQHSTCWEMKRKLNYKPTREDVRLSWSSLVGSFTHDILYQDIFRHRRYLNWPKSVRGPSISYNRVAWIQWRWFI